MSSLSIRLRDFELITHVQRHILVKGCGKREKSQRTGSPVKSEDESDLDDSPVESKNPI